MEPDCIDFTLEKHPIWLWAGYLIRWGLPSCQFLENQTAVCLPSCPFQVMKWPCRVLCSGFDCTQTPPLFLQSPYLTEVSLMQVSKGSLLKFPINLPLNWPLKLTYLRWNIFDPHIGAFSKCIKLLSGEVTLCIMFAKWIRNPSRIANCCSKSLSHSSHS